MLRITSYIALILVLFCLMHISSCNVDAYNTEGSWCTGDINSLFCNEEYKWDAKTMIAICMIENGYQYNHEWNQYMVFDGNANLSVDKGICSINSIHGFDPEMLFDPAYNIGSAYKIWLSQGYEAWSIYNSGKYKLAYYEIL